MQAKAGQVLGRDHRLGGSYRASVSPASHRGGFIRCGRIARPTPNP